jgi:hypothetical protein
MSLNHRVASILAQAANRRYDVKKASFRPSDDATDHSERKVVWSIVKYPEGQPKGADLNPSGILEITDRMLGEKAADVLEGLLGPEPASLAASQRNRAAASVDDRRRLLDASIKELIEQ